MGELLGLALLTAGWCALHSLLIAAPVTGWLRRRLGSRYRFHRLSFDLISLGTLVPVLRYRAQVAGEALFSWEGWWLAPRVLLIGAAAALFVAGGRNYDLLQFLGVRQLMGRSTRSGLTAGGTLDTSGILAYVRHPWYLGALLLIWARTLDRSVVVMNLVLSVYLVVGTVLEERKLVAEFGEEYRQYQQRVPMLLPWFTWRRG